MEVLTVIGIIATVLAAFATFYGVYISTKKDDKPIFLLTGNNTFIQHNNAISLEIDNYYRRIQPRKRKRHTTKSKLQEELIEYVIEVSSLISYLKKIALSVSLLFTSIYIILVKMEVDLTGVSYIQNIVDSNSNFWVSIFAYSCLFILMYAFIMFVVTSFFTRDFLYQSRIRGSTTDDKISQIKKILINQFNFRKHEEFPIRMLTRMKDNIRISQQNSNAKAYNNRTKHTPRKPEIPPKNIFLDNLYFKTTILILLVNIFYVFFGLSNKNNHPLPIYSDQSMQPNNICDPKYSYIKSTKNWRSGWKKHASIYCDFTIISTPRGYYILNSPDVSDIHSFKHQNTITVSGYVNTEYMKYYFTKSSYGSSSPKLIYVPD